MTVTTAVIAVLVFIILIQTLTNQLDRRRQARSELLLVKAVIANNEHEFLAAQDSPKEAIKKMQIENDLATKAVIFLPPI